MMRGPSPFVLLLCLVFGTAAVLADDDEPPLEDVVGRVDGRAVTEGELRQEDIRLRDRMRSLLFAREALRRGVTVREEILSEVVNEELEQRLARATREAGRSVTAEEWLAARGLTPGTFRQRVRTELLARVLLMDLEGRLRADPLDDPSDEAVRSETRRLFESGHEAFFMPRQQREALFLFRVARRLDGDTSRAAAEEVCRASAEALLRDLRAGARPEQLARRHGLPAEDWAAAAPDEFRVVHAPASELETDFERWMNAPARKAGDAKIFPQPEGSYVVCVLERRAARGLSFEEGLPRLLERIREARTARVSAECLLEILDDPEGVGPPRLVEALRRQARRELAAMEKDPLDALVKRLLEAGRMASGEEE